MTGSGGEISRRTLMMAGAASAVMVMAGVCGYAQAAEHVSWGFLDYRRDGEAFQEGYQSVPADWKIDTERKRGFFNLLSEITGEGSQVR